jgi:hypothetical protein
VRARGLVDGARDLVHRAVEVRLCGLLGRAARPLADDGEGGEGGGADAAFRP